jgi:hypothetical protein
MVIHSPCVEVLEPTKHDVKTVAVDGLSFDLHPR